jgi:GTPase involved in cell partitioning and DNA repair
MDFLKDNFRELFNVCHMCLDLMDLIEEEKLEEFIKKEIKRNFTKEEIIEKFKNSPKDKLVKFINEIYAEEEEEEK